MINFYCQYQKKLEHPWQKARIYGVITTSVTSSTTMSTKYSSCKLSQMLMTNHKTYWEGYIQIQTQLND